MIDPDSLEAGEQVLWQGKPDAATYPDRMSHVAPSIGICMLAFGAAAVVLSRSADLQTVGVALLVLGAFFAFRPLSARRMARRTSYAVTDRRAIIETPGIILRNRFSVPFGQIRRIDVKDSPGLRCGDVIFYDHVTNTEHGLEGSRGGFFAIEDVRQVEQLLRHGAAASGGRYSESFRE